MKPCIRNLQAFKKGCPEDQSCPCWIEKEVTIQENGQNPERRIIKQCLDLWMFQLAWSNNSLVETTNGTIESFRNNTHKAAGVLISMANSKLLEVR